MVQQGVALETGFEELERKLGSLPNELERVNQARHKAIAILNYIGDPKSIRSWEDLIYRLKQSLKGAEMSREIYDPQPKSKLSFLLFWR